MSPMQFDALLRFQNENGDHDDTWSEPKFIRTGTSTARTTHYSCGACGAPISPGERYQWQFGVDCEGQRFNDKWHDDRELCGALAKEVARWQEEMHALDSVDPYADEPEAADADDHWQDVSVIEQDD